MRSAEPQVHRLILLACSLLCSAARRRMIRAAMAACSARAIWAALAQCRRRAVSQCGACRRGRPTRSVPSAGWHRSRHFEFAKRRAQLEGRRRATSSSAPCSLSRSLRTASWPCAQQPMAFFGAKAIDGCGARPRRRTSGQALIAGPAKDRLSARSERAVREHDGGRTLRRVPGLPQTSEITALAVIPGCRRTFWWR